ncbi:Conserved Hypothetical Protein [Streptomyces leeuwenhoekii]|uniref:Transmembrane protein n=1 Tax=Streptomyces leeuwenhoekii TaxID=1437453 RepID=A0A0F7W266_STRLW|nr:Conserved Hypothetical Protein [Streptomyces leeuwenhoekii]
MSEARQEYERILDEALRLAPHRTELSGLGQRLDPGQLRTLALDATALITTAAATEYQHCIRFREGLRQPAAPVPAASDSGSTAPGPRVTGPAATVEEAVETAGAGAVAVVAVLAPVLAGTAAVFFLLVGYVLRMLDPERAFARTLLTTGWVFGALAAAAILVAAAGLLITALRNRPSAEAGRYRELSREVAEAREAWRDALLTRRVLPFLRDALSDSGTAGAPPRTAPSVPASRMPALGYDRPGFTSPATARPRGTARASRAPTTPARTPAVRRPGRSSGRCGSGPPRDPRGRRTAGRGCRVRTRGEGCRAGGERGRRRERAVGGPPPRHSTGPVPSGDARSVPRRETCGQSAIGRYTLLPAAANSFDFWAMPCSISAWLPPCSRRMSCEIFMLQNFGPHIEQK